MTDDFTNYFKDFLDIDDLEVFLNSRLFTGTIMIDDPVDFINGFNLALAYAFKAQIYDMNEEAKFRISLAIWLRKYIDKMEMLN